MRCLVVGGSGQDGTLITAQLLAEGHQVVSVSRRPIPLGGVEYQAIDVLDRVAVEKLISDVHPDQIYYLAAWHRSSQDKPPSLPADLESSLAVNANAFAGVLDAAKRYVPGARTVYASSCRVFGRGEGLPLDESAPRRPICAYGVSKTAGMAIAEIFRHDHGMQVSTAILFNHESELRGENFVSKKLALAAIAARNDPHHKITVASLDDVADWGAARDHVAAMRAIVKADKPGDFVVATGQLRSVREFADACFSAVGLDWEQHVVCPSAGACSGWRLVGNPAKLMMQTGWKPAFSFAEMVQDLINRTLLYERQRSADFHSYL
jgi:GDPmannose 4,6-dehydratase